MAGPASDYGYTSFGSDVTPRVMFPRARWRRLASMTLARTRSGMPSRPRRPHLLDRRRSRRTEVLLPGTTKQQSVTYAAKNKVVSFSVDGSLMEPPPSSGRTSNCNQCHVAFGPRWPSQSDRYCVLCHIRRTRTSHGGPQRLVAADKAAAPARHQFQSHWCIAFIPVRPLANKSPLCVVGFGGSHNDFSEVAIRR